ncbi:MAG: radical SAM family heme chaperone HemW [Gammaproteobacteria bacterium]|nr:MAG: radical SAM family heme chaperone HemW [Gammaproteobacteria bacterium]UTW43749.1 radical SAM family heme chaperone HemW [bacterium SCSIO 12844]
MLQLPPLSLYIHFPWCVKKCPYCDFNSHQLKTKLPDSDYLNSLLNDLKIHLNDMQGRQFQSIFLGGGTPSLFPTNSLSLLFNYLFNENLVAENAEITLEVNPGTVERGLFKDYKAMGINRISLGVQSFQNDKLKQLGRIHNKDEIYIAVNEIKTSGIENFNLDLMHGLPNQNTKDALFDLSEAIKLSPTHLSWYQLTLEPNTQFERQPPLLPDEAILEAIELQGKALLAENQFKHYEVSAYAKNGLFSVHNMNYWQFGDYIGIGAGAHSKVTYVKQNAIKRYWKVKHPKFYLKSNAYVSGSEIVDSKQLIYEFALNALRLNFGFSYDLFESRTGLNRNVLTTIINKALKLELIDNTIENQLIPTYKGRLYLNNLINLFS